LKRISEGVAVASAIDSIDLRAAGTAALVTVDGHFPSGTHVSVADTIIDVPANGMLLKTPRRLTFVVAGRASLRRTRDNEGK
jgi:hypothetical protein